MECNKKPNPRSTRTVNKADSFAYRLSAAYFYVSVKNMLLKNLHQFFSLGTLLIIAVLICGCSDEFRTEDYEAGPNGEPPRVLEGFQVYTKQFTADEKNYVLALGQIHAFLIANSYYPILYSACFDDVLDIRVTAHVERHKKRFPCIALQAENGAPTKAYLSVTIENVMFNQYSGPHSPDNF